MPIPLYLPRTTFWRHAVPTNPEPTGHQHLEAAYRAYRSGDALTSRAHLFAVQAGYSGPLSQLQALRASSLECLVGTAAALRQPGVAWQDGLLSRRWTALMGDSGDPSYGPWIELFDAYQRYTHGETDQAAEAWNRIALDDSAEDLLHGLARLGVAQVAAEDRDGAAFTNAVGWAFDAMKKAGNRAGCGQAQLLAAEIYYLFGRKSLADAELRGADGVYRELQDSSGLSDVNLVGLIGAVVAGDSELAEQALRATENDLVGPQVPRVSAEQVAALVEFSRRMPALVGYPDPRPFETRLTDAREIHRWASATGDPMLQLASLRTLSAVLMEGGYWSDAGFFDVLRSGLSRSYRAAVPLNLRLQRAALFDFDFYSRNGVVERGEHPTFLVNFTNFAESHLASQAALREGAAGEFPEIDWDAVKEGSAEYAKGLRMIAREAEGCRAELLRLLQIGDRKAATEPLIKMFVQMKVLTEFFNEFKPLTRSLRRSLSVNREYSRPGKKAYKLHAQFDVSVILSRPKEIKLELLHAHNYYDFQRDVIGAVLVGNDAYVRRGVSNLVKFYEQHRESLEPPMALDEPLVFNLGLVLPDQEKERDQRIDAAVKVIADLHCQEAARAEVAKDPEAPIDLADIAQDSPSKQDDRIFFESAFEPSGGPAVLSHAADVSEENGVVAISLAHTARLGYKVKPDSMYGVEPPVSKTPDFGGRAAVIRAFWEDSPLPARRPRFDVLLQSFHLLAMSTNMLGRLAGTALEETMRSLRAFDSTIEVGQTALSAQGRGDFLELEGFRSMEEWLRLAQSDPSTREWLGAIARSDATQNREGAEALAETVRNVLGAFHGERQETSGEASDPVDTLRTIQARAATAQMLGFRPMLFLVLGDSAGAAAAAKKLIAQFNKGEFGEGDQADGNRLSLALYLIASGEYAPATAVLQQLIGVRQNDARLSFQALYLLAMCNRRMGNPEAEHLSEAAGRLDRLRATLRTRNQASALQRARVLIYEEYLNTLYAAKQYAEMARVISQYRRASATPAALLMGDESEAANLIREAAFLHDVLSRDDIWKLGDDELFALIRAAGLELGAEADPKETVRTGLDLIVNVLADQLKPSATAVRSAETASHPDCLTLYFFSGSGGLYRVAEGPAGTANASFTPLGSGELNQLCAAFVGALKDCSEPPARLGEILLGGLPELGGVSRVRVEPDGPMNFVPFQAMRASANGPRLVETHVVEYLSGIFAADIAMPSGEASRILVIGNPDGTLPAAEEEARAISRLTGFDAKKPLLGSKATIGNIGSRLEGAGCVHFATHAVPNPEHPHFAYLKLAGWDRLYSLDLAGLSFRGKRVYLSACETRIGQTLPGDDVYGLADAFLSAGALSVVCSLWRLEDESTSLFARRFYEFLAETQDTAESLARTAREFIGGKYVVDRDGVATPLTHPFYWAGLNCLAPSRPKTLGRSS